MADFKTHITVSGMLGVGCALGATLGNFTGVQAVLAGCLTGCAGMLPDLDSDTGRPLKEVFGVTAALAPTLMMERLLHWGGDAEGAMLLAILMYISIRYGASTLLGLVTVHRGMFHSIPAALIAAELTALSYKSPVWQVKALMGGGVLIGFLSHLVLDEIYSVQWNGMKVRLKASAGSALKFFGKSLPSNALAYGLLATISWSMMIESGLTNLNELERDMEPLAHEFHLTPISTGEIRSRQALQHDDVEPTRRRGRF